MRTLWKITLIFAFLGLSHDVKAFDKDCLKGMTKAVDRFIDQYRDQINDCKKDDDCVWQEGGSGVHVNRKKFTDFQKCFKYANRYAENFCTYGIRSAEPVPRGFLRDNFTPLRPESYSCVREKCVALYSTNKGLAVSSQNPKWKPAMIDDERAKTATKKEMNCMKDVDKKMPKYLMGH